MVRKKQIAIPSRVTEEMLAAERDPKNTDIDKKLTIKSLAEKTGINYHTLDNNLNGETPMSLHNALTILEYFKLHIPTHRGIEFLQSIRDHYELVQREGLEMIDSDS